MSRSNQRASATTRPRIPRSSLTLRRAAAPAAAVNPFLGPRGVRDLSGRTFARLQEQAYAGWLTGRRVGVAALLRVGLESGLYPATALTAAFAAPTPQTALYRLLEQTLTALPDWLDALARRALLEPTPMPSWQPFVALRLDDGPDEALFLVLAVQSVWMHTVHLDGLPPRLAIAIAETLALIGEQLTPACFLRDLAGCWLDEDHTTYAALRDQHLPDDAARWAYVHDQTDWLNWFDWDEASFADWWARMDAYDQPQAIWLRRWLRRPWRPTDVRLRGIIRRRWRLRHQAALRRLPWWRWLRQAIRVLRWTRRHAPHRTRPGMSPAGLEEDGGTSLEMAQALSFDEPWEPTFCEDYYTTWLESGEDCGWRLPCDPTTNALGATLQAFATGQGLLIGACQADALTQGRDLAHL
ncbi:hypothetical protein BN873_950048 [Candidatus Competibacter denitrificans Run_A_D11]|uniref:Uncharacterized protein n=1 Tax=Candidatus Competibacter denitrificans Run_A_D11 TaxID=1400863 RepID=W6MCV2_9GAMM|nr:hypothetical protein BN873_950048 [Candidatus Competibacter denitrificans Run_A_D11]